MPTDVLIADRLEIADLFSRFARMLDEKRFEDAGTVYADDVTVRSPRGGRLHGLDEVVGYLREAEVEGDRTQHVTTDLLVDVSGDQAAASANSLVYFYRDGRPPFRSSGLRLGCTAVRTPSGWRFRELRITLAWSRED
ncbi:nuclear transport factor 2 family protein [Actinomadura fibrosa]|uniref:Nuclear transport factor 2 family protein n=1 Tax=Actinomadura fibrosa TaxID=111802 RepID=A0ABW2XJT8_9ACTN|nr:nuclear transport factor 2 family protein [Actinomadura fibrosa]